MTMKNAVKIKELFAKIDSLEKVINYCEKEISAITEEIVKEKNGGERMTRAEELYRKLEETGEEADVFIVMNGNCPCDYDIECEVKHVKDCINDDFKKCLSCWRKECKETSETSVENDPVEHPAHYTDGKIEVIDYITDKKFDFCLGNAVKYISRAGKKDKEKTVEDLKKAVWYINKEIEILEGKNE